MERVTIRDTFIFVPQSECLINCLYSVSLYPVILLIRGHINLVYLLPIYENIIEG